MASDLSGDEQYDRQFGKAENYVLRLYVTGATPRSARAVSNVRRICDVHLAGRYQLEVVDIYEQPKAASEHQIVAAPTLVKLLPMPMRKIIGDLSDEARALAALGIETAPSEFDGAS